MPQAQAGEAQTKLHASMLQALTARPVDIDRSAVAVALSLAGKSAAGCISRDDERRSMPVSVTFAASGRVTSSRIEGGPFAGTEIGACIARALRAARVGAFDGEPVTIHTAIHLR